MDIFPAFLVMTDISGYTRFMRMHTSSLLHAEQIITELIEAVLDKADYPLTVGKQEGDGVFFYHSSCPQPGIAGIAEVASAPYPDPSQFDRKSPYYDPKSKRDAPRWICVDIRALKKTALVPFLLEGVGGDPKLNQADGIHPNPAGQAKVADNVWKVLEGQLAE